MNAILKLEAKLYPKPAPSNKGHRGWRIVTEDAYAERVARVVAWWNACLARSRTRG